jgi:hypothetical protein
MKIIYYNNNDNDDIMENSLTHSLTNTHTNTKTNMNTQQKFFFSFVQKKDIKGKIKIIMNIKGNESHLSRAISSFRFLLNKDFSFL